MPGVEIARIGGHALLDHVGVGMGGNRFLESDGGSETVGGAVLRLDGLELRQRRACRFEVAGQHLQLAEFGLEFRIVGGRAERLIEQQMKQLYADVMSEVVDSSVQAAESVLSEKLNAQDQQKLAQSYLAELGKSAKQEGRA